VQRQLQTAGLRVALDDRNEKMNAKIRDLTMQKIPYLLVMGDKEAAANAVSVRTRGKGDQGSVPLEDFIVKSRKLIDEKDIDL
jgi:threonyl-tRNA synthetase